jgi:hypothetical protein
MPHKLMIVHCHVCARPLSVFGCFHNSIPWQLVMPGSAKDTHLYSSVILVKQTNNKNNNNWWRSSQPSNFSPSLSPSRGPETGWRFNFAYIDAVLWDLHGFVKDIGAETQIAGGWTIQHSPRVSSGAPYFKCGRETNPRSIRDRGRFGPNQYVFQKRINSRPSTTARKGTSHVYFFKFAAICNWGRF